MSTSLKVKETPSTDPKFEVVTIDPDFAAKLLERNFENRPLKSHKVQTYGAAMKAGDWKLNGDPIRLYSSGELCDGQHRLVACVQSKTPFETVMITGLDKDVHATIDIGANRTASDHLVFTLGFSKTEATMISAGSKNIMVHDDGIARWAQGGGSVNKYGTPSMVSAWVDANIDVVTEASEFIMKAFEQPSIVNKSTAFSLYILFCRVDKVMAKEFMWQVLTGKGLVEGSNQEFLRGYLLRQLAITGTRKMPVHIKTYTIAKVFKATARGYTFAGPANIPFRITSDVAATFPGFGEHDYINKHK